MVSQKKMWQQWKDGRRQWGGVRMADFPFDQKNVDDLWGIVGNAERFTAWLSGPDNMVVGMAVDHVTPDAIQRVIQMATEETAANPDIDPYMGVLIAPVSSDRTHIKTAFDAGVRVFAYRWADPFK